jgi:hypothetical protein
VAVSHAQRDARKVKTFGTAIKNGNLQVEEQVIFEHNSTEGGVVTEVPQLSFLFLSSCSYPSLLSSKKDVDDRRLGWFQPNKSTHLH